MYKNVIDVRKDALQDILHALAEAADRAFDNRAGKIENTSDTPYRFIYRRRIFILLLAIRHACIRKKHGVFVLFERMELD